MRLLQAQCSVFIDQGAIDSPFKSVSTEIKTTSILRLFFLWHSYFPKASTIYKLRLERKDASLRDKSCQKKTFSDIHQTSWPAGNSKSGRRVRCRSFLHTISNTVSPLALYVTDQISLPRRTVTFIDKDDERHTYKVADGDNLLDIAQANDLEMEGACGGSCACSTCHVVVEDEAYYDKMEEPTDEENDMLDLAFGLTETSRLGCQVKMNKDLDGLTVKLPSMTRNLQASDFGTK